jgi:hypothetical protein
MEVLGVIRPSEIAVTKTHGCIMKVAVDGYMEVTALLGPGELDVPEEQPLAVIPG